MSSSRAPVRISEDFTTEEISTSVRSINTEIKRQRNNNSNEVHNTIIAALSSSGVSSIKNNDTTTTVVLDATNWNQPHVISSSSSNDDDDDDDDKSRSNHDDNHDIEQGKTSCDLEQVAIVTPPREVIITHDKSINPVHGYVRGNVTSYVVSSSDDDEPKQIYNDMDEFIPQQTLSSSAHYSLEEEQNTSKDDDNRDHHPDIIPIESNTDGNNKEIVVTEKTLDKRYIFAGILLVTIVIVIIVTATTIAVLRKNNSREVDSIAAPNNATSNSMGSTPLGSFPSFVPTIQSPSSTMNPTTMLLNHPSTVMTPIIDHQYNSTFPTMLSPSSITYEPTNIPTGSKTTASPFVDHQYDSRFPTMLSRNSITYEPTNTPQQQTSNTTASPSLFISSVPTVSPTYDIKLSPAEFPVTMYPTPPTNMVTFTPTRNPNIPILVPTFLWPIFASPVSNNQPIIAPSFISTPIQLTIPNSPTQSSPTLQVLTPSPNVVPTIATNSTVVIITTNPTNIPINLPSTNTPTRCPRTPAVMPLPGKRGIGYTMRNPGQLGSYIENVPKIVKLNVYWNYNWALTYLTGIQPDSSLFVPMVWGAGKSSEVLAEALNNLSIAELYNNNTITHLLGFNEPDRNGQANMDVNLAIERWYVLQSINVPLVGPSCGTPDGDWMKEFVSVVEERCLRLNGIGVHWYGPPNVANFQNKMLQIYQLYNSQYPLFITEFAVVDYSATSVNNNRYQPKDALEFMKVILPWMEQTNYIMSYAWFPFELNSPTGWISALFDENDNLTKLGQYYQSIRNENINGDLTIT